MATVKNRGTFRATNLAENTTPNDFKALLENKLTPEERQKGFKISKIDLAPIPSSRNGDQSAIFKFEPNAPTFLDDVLTKGEIHIRDDKNEQSIKIDAEFWGITQLYKANGPIDIDVVALSGLNAHAFGSWSGATSDGSNPMWLKDFLVKERGLGHRCRVMVYGYNAKTKSTAVHTTLDYASGLLEELSKARSRPEEELRPLILLGHSYGGLVIAHAFTTASYSQRYRSIYHSTIRILCFGVPYRGIDLTDVGEMVQSDPKAYDQGISLLKAISYEASTITSNTNHFRHLISVTKTRLVSFFETFTTKKVKQTEDKKSFARIGEPVIVVPKSSAVLGLTEDLEEAYDVDGDHSTLVKFTSRSDRAYTTIVALLHKIIESGSKEVKARKAADERQEQHQRASLNTQVFDGLAPENIRFIKSQLLRIAADANLHIRVEWLLKIGADPNYIRDRQSPGDLDLNSRWLFNLNEEPTDSMTAGKKASQATIARILESDVTALALAVKRGNSRIVIMLLEKGADPNLSCSGFADGRTPLHEACRDGSSDIVQYLLKYKADPNAATGDFATTPLHEVAEAGVFLCDLLVGAGANINAQKNINKNTALHIAAQNGKTGVVYTLCQKGADVTVRNRKGFTPLHEAAAAGHLAVVKILLRENEEKVINIQDTEDGRTALHEAAEAGHKDIVAALLEKGADRTIKNEYDETALDLAVENGKDDVVKVLESS
ncbi:hypothetical protein TWF694_010448 [Orbilia ellipsospora]|uniref:Uncharacterized protein n=1 Tax=Orbilia ellipsospora TaxID=2528407 RepID=A0AAV9XA94_9PEZI